MWRMQHNLVGIEEDSKNRNLLIEDCWTPRYLKWSQALTLGAQSMRSLSYGKFAISPVLIVLAYFTIAASAFAQKDGEDVVIGKWHSIESKILDETRKLVISLPDNYKKSEKTYPVLYLLDGPGHFHHTTGLIDFLSSNGVMPEMIVVAIANTNRTRDLTPPLREPNPDVTNGGGADNFIRFLDEELIPHIDKNFRTHDYRVLIGHSYGGLFAVHALVHQPDLFDAYLAISPSLQWDNQNLVAQADKFFQSNKSLKKTLYMTTGNEGRALTGGVLKIAGILTEHLPNEFEWDSRIMEEETHGSVVHRSTRQGLEFIFQHWVLRDPAAKYEQGGVEAIHAYFKQSGDRYRINRSTPANLISRLGWRLGMNGRMKEAREVLEHDTEKYPPNPAIYTMLGKNFMEKKNDKVAIEYFKRARELSPEDTYVTDSLKKLGVDVSALEQK